MIIEVKMPCGPFDAKKLIDAHNEALFDSSADWVVLINHDIYLACNPRWYEVLIEGLSQVNKDSTAFVTCVASDRGDSLPQSADIPADHVRNPDLSLHEQDAEMLYEKYGAEMREVNDTHVASYFIVMNRRLCIEKGFLFRQIGRGMEKMDHDLAERVLNAGYKIYVMPGLYVYHRRSRWERKRAKKK